MPRSLQERFRGRATDLWAIFHELATVPSLAAPRSCCVSGPPGMGKTQLVAEFAWRYGRRHFEGGIVWVDAVAEGDAVKRQIADAVSALRESGGEDLTPDQVVRRAAAKGRVLWVVDGIRPPGGQAPEELDQWCPFRGDVTLLCTSRAARLLDVDVSIDLRSLSINAAVDLIASAGVRRERLDAEKWATIAKWVGCVPQALQIQHAVLKSGFREPRDLLRAAEARADPVGEIEAGFAELRSELPTGWMSGITETFDIWYENLSNDRELRNAAHLLARSVAPSGGLLARGLLTKLAIRSWVQMVERPDGSGDAEPTWRINDLVRSYLLVRSPDPSLEVVQLACKYLGFGGPRTVMHGLPRGGLDVLANVKSLSPLSLEEIAHSVLERALSRPDEMDLAVAAELLGSLRDESARTLLAGALKGGTEILWPLTLYLRYVQGFAKPPLELKEIRRNGSTLTLPAESLLHAPPTPEQSVTLMAPLLAVLQEAPLSAAIMAATWTAEIPHTRWLIESELLRQVKASPDRAFMLAGAIVTSDIEFGRCVCGNGPNRRMARA